MNLWRHDSVYIMVLGGKNSDAEQMNGSHELLGSLWLSLSYSSRGARVNAGAQGLERNFQRWELFCALFLEISKSTDTQIKIEYWSSTQDFEMKSISTSMRRHFLLYSLWLTLRHNHLINCVLFLKIKYITKGNFLCSDT